MGVGGAQDGGGVGEGLVVEGWEGGERWAVDQNEEVGCVGVVLGW